MKEYLQNLIFHVGRFDTIQHVMVTPGDDTVEASAFAKDKTILVTASGPAVEGLDTPVCLGGFKVLSKLLGMEQIKGAKGSLEPEVGDDSKGNPIIREIVFKGPRIKAVYQATDPRVADVKVPNLKSLKWEVTAKIEPEVAKEFSDALGIQSAIEEKKVDEFELRAIDGELRFKFGDKTEITVATGVEGEIEPVRFSAPKMQVILQTMSADGGGTLEVAEKALRATCKSGDVSYAYVLPINVSTAR